MQSLRHVSLVLAIAMQTGPASLPGLRLRCAEALGDHPVWLNRLCQRAWQRYGADIVRAPLRELARHLATFPQLRDALLAADPPRIVHYPLRPPLLLPPPWLPQALPPITGSGELAHWLGISAAELDWFAQSRGEADIGPLHHYTYRWLPKRDGGWRLLESPKSRLRALQRRILHGILDRVPPHDAAHGFCRGRSTLSYVAPHVGTALVIRMDLRDFFASITRRRIHALWHTLGYPESVARLLAGICCHITAEAIVRQAPDAATPRSPLRQPHLAQGAPTSPSLANLCAFRLDLRLAALAASLGARYTRYADDLAFSGGAELRRAQQRLRWQVIDIAAEEGFRVHTGKTRLMPAGVRQQLTGIVLNQHPNPPRAEYDRLKAILHNCLRHGPASQNRGQHADFQAYLQGRLGYFAQINPRRGQRLQALLNRIEWGGK